jgi:uncharacterized protein YkwD
VGSPGGGHEKNCGPKIIKIMVILRAGGSGVGAEELLNPKSAVSTEADCALASRAQWRDPLLSPCRALAHTANCPSTMAVMAEPPFPRLSPEARVSTEMQPGPSRPLPLLLLLLLLVLFLAASANAQNVAEQYLLQRTNQHRAEHHLAPLAWDPALARAAQTHALRIVQEVNRRPGPAEHQYPGEPALLARASQAGAHFSTISENVAGNGQSAAELDVAWMNSPVHRANILDPKLNAVGIAVVQSRGLLYAVEDFARNVPALTPGDAQARAEQALLSHGIRLEPSAQARADARHACSSQSAVAPSEPALLMQWEGPDLSQLPATILPQLHAGRTRTVAIASCPTTRPTQGFTTYHIAILIY